MRHLVACAVLLASAAVAGERSGITVLLQFDESASSRSVEALRTELASLIRPAGLELDYRLGSELGPDETPADIIVVRFRGTCRTDTRLMLPDERGPFAFTHASDGEILPFAEVACDRVQTSLRQLAGRVDPRRADEIFGRALGRVVAHEIYHIVAKTPHHGSKGVARKGLTRDQLVADHLVFDEEDLRKLQTRAGGSR